jgi:hypothetical protein
MKKVIEYLFYNIYTFARDLKNDRSPQYTAGLSIALLIYFNLLSIILLFGTKIRYKIVSPNLFRLGLLLLFVLVFVSCYYLLLKKKSFQSILLRYRANTKKPFDVVLTLLYIFLTFILLLFSFFQLAPTGASGPLVR